MRKCLISLAPKIHFANPIPSSDQIPIGAHPWSGPQGTVCALSFRAGGFGAAFGDGGCDLIAGDRDPFAGGFLADVTNEHTLVVRRGYSNPHVQVANSAVDCHRACLVRRAKSIPLGVGESTGNDRRARTAGNAGPLSPPQTCR